MKKKIIAMLILSGLCLSAIAQEQPQEEQKYRRSSLYSLLLSHSDTKYSKEIEEVFTEIPIPDRFDDHDLSVKIITTDRKKTSGGYSGSAMSAAVGIMGGVSAGTSSAGSSVDVYTIASFLERNEVAKRLVARWFDRDRETGACDMQLIMNRGLYDATYYDVELARMSSRGYGILQDAGEELIGNTFVVVNDITYRDKEQSAQKWANIINAVGNAAAGYAGHSSGNANLAASISAVSTLASAVVSEIRGFSVIVTSYLFRLEWDDDLAGDFYSNCYFEAGNDVDWNKASAFRSRNYSLRYIGCQTIQSGKITMNGVGYDPSAFIKKVCTRSIDKSLVELQRSYDEFKIKTPLFSVSPTITCKIGMKEGVTDKNKYEVLERVIDNNGKASYRRVGVIQPVAGRIWDNRYMAVEEGAANATLEATTFRKLSGGDFYPGMLIREIK